MEAEKAKSHNLFAGISKTLRILEICIVLILLSWTLTRLPIAVTVSVDYLRRLAASPLFIFAVSNAIIAALIAQSSRFSGQHSAEHSTTDGLYGEIMNSRVTVTVADREEPPSTAVDPPPRSAVDPPPVEEECHDKEVVSEEIRDSDAGAGTDLANYRRSQSEKWKKGEVGKMQRRKELRRSETEKLKLRKDLYPQDKLSNEEFQREIEAFIAKQTRFLREESSAIVLHNTA